MTERLAEALRNHEHEWERGQHMKAAFGIDARRLACALCGLPKSEAGEPAEPAITAESPPDEVPAPIGIRVMVRQRIQREWVIEDVVWPKGWPLPEQGAIFQGHTLQGWVEHIEMDIVTQRIIVVLR